MSGLIDYAINHARLTVAMLVFLLLAGLTAYVTIPKEAEPDVKIPIIYAQLSQRGISPEDSERLLLRPVETLLKSVGNVKEMRSTAFEGGGFVLLEFEAGFDASLYDGRVTAEVTGFLQRTYSALIPLQNPPSQGFLSPQLTNVGTLEFTTYLAPMAFRASTYSRLRTTFTSPMPS